MGSGSCRNLWFSCVLPHALSNLRYLRTKTQINLVESSLTRSLKRAFQHFELPAPLQLEVGLPPLVLQQAQHLVRIHFRYTVVMPEALPSKLYSAQTTQKHLLPPNAIENRICQAYHRLGIFQHYPTWKSLPSYITSPKTKNKEKAFSNYLKQTVSKIWLRETLDKHPLPVLDQAPTSRMQAYLSIAQKDLARNLYKPAPYFQVLGKFPTKYMFRMRTQNSPAIPTHSPRPHKSAHLQYPDRKCTLCLQAVTGHERHVFFDCPHTAHLALPAIEVLKQFISWHTYKQDQKIAVLLGSTPHTLKRKQIHQWAIQAIPTIIQMAATIHSVTKKARIIPPTRSLQLPRI